MNWVINRYYVISCGEHFSLSPQHNFIFALIHNLGSGDMETAERAWNQMVAECGPQTTLAAQNILYAYWLSYIYFLEIKQLCIQQEKAE